MNYKNAVLVSILLLPSNLAVAGGEPEAHFDIFIARPATGDQTLVGGALVPGDLNLDERIFEGDLETDVSAGNNFYTTTEPGFFNAGANSPGLLGATNPPGALALTPGESFTVNNVAFSLDAISSDLFYWDGAGAVNFVSSPAELVITQTDGVAGTDGSIDDHPFFDIDDLGSNDLPPGGIYLAPLQVELAGLEPSDPVLVLFVTGEEFEDSVELAEEYLAGRLIPEPSAVVLVACAMAVVGIVVRRN